MSVPGSAGWLGNHLCNGSLTNDLQELNENSGEVENEDILLSSFNSMNFPSKNKREQKS